MFWYQKPSMLPILISNNQNYYKKCKFANITHNKLQGIEGHRASKVKLQKFSFNNLILSY